MTTDCLRIGDTEESLSQVGYELFKNRVVPAETTCVVTIGSIGKLCLTKEASVCNQAVNCIVVDRQRHDPYFVFYLMKMCIPKVKLLSSGTASGRENVSKSAFEGIKVRTPPLPVQKHIGKLLRNFDELVENSQQRVRILVTTARALYREWFVDFRFPDFEKHPRAPSLLGDIPEGWEVRKLGDILKLNYGKALKKEDRRDGVYPVYGSSGQIGIHDSSLANGPGIVVGRKGNVGSVFWCEDDFFVIDTAYFVTSTLPLRYLYYVLPTLNFINSDAAVPGLSRNQAYTLEILVPPDALLAKFCDLADTFEQQATTLCRQINNLRRTRDLLLPRLLSGQVSLQES